LFDAVGFEAQERAKHGILDNDSRSYTGLHKEIKDFDVKNFNHMAITPMYFNEHDDLNKISLLSKSDIQKLSDLYISEPNKEEFKIICEEFNRAKGEMQSLMSVDLYNSLYKMDHEGKAIREAIELRKAVDDLKKVIVDVEYKKSGYKDQSIDISKISLDSYGVGSITSDWQERKLLKGTVKISDEELEHFFDALSNKVFPNPKLVKGYGDLRISYDQVVENFIEKFGAYQEVYEAVYNRFSEKVHERNIERAERIGLAEQSLPQTPENVVQEPTDASKLLSPPKRSIS
jgi:hypothetical protein